MAAIVSAVEEHGDLMRMSISAPGNDFRLGACEAPPAIVSTYLGEDMTNYLEAFKDGKTGGEDERESNLSVVLHVNPTPCCSLRSPPASLAARFARHPLRKY